MLTIKNIILDFLKGIAIGIANVIPGFSGGTMAVILKVYERVINAFSELVKHPVKVIKDIWSILLGLAVGIIVAIVTIVKLLEFSPLPTLMFFVGLLLGAIPDLYKEYNSAGKFRYFNILFFLIAVIIIVVLPFFTGSTKTIVKIDFWIFFLIINKIEFI